jgi:hypothetical protein
VGPEQTSGPNHFPFPDLEANRYGRKCTGTFVPQIEKSARETVLAWVEGDESKLLENLVRTVREVASGKTLALERIVSPRLIRSYTRQFNGPQGAMRFSGTRWYRDPDLPICASESLTRCPCPGFITLLHKEYRGHLLPFTTFVIYLQNAMFPSGAEEIRIPDLRRAKVARHFARPFRCLQKGCKIGGFCDRTFPELSGPLLRLLHGCCTGTGWSPSCISPSMKRNYPMRLGASVLTKRISRGELAH